VRSVWVVNEMSSVVNEKPGKMSLEIILPATRATKFNGISNAEA